MSKFQRRKPRGHIQRTRNKILGALETGVSKNLVILVLLGWRSPPRDSPRMKMLTFLPASVLSCRRRCYRELSRGREGKQRHAERLRGRAKLQAHLITTLQRYPMRVPHRHIRPRRLHNPMQQHSRHVARRSRNRSPRPHPWGGQSSRHLLQSRCSREMAIRERAKEKEALS